MNKGVDTWKDIIHSQVFSMENFNKTYILPRGSGVTTFLIGLLKEFKAVYSNDNLKIVVILPNDKTRRFYQSFFRSNIVIPTEFAEMIGMPKIPEETTFKFLIESEIKSDLTGTIIDWLITDNVDDSILDNFMSSNPIINNSLLMYTV